MPAADAAVAVVGVGVGIIGAALWPAPNAAAAAGGSPFHADDAACAAAFCAACGETFGAAIGSAPVPLCIALCAAERPAASAFAMVCGDGRCPWSSCWSSSYFSAGVSGRPPCSALMCVMVARGVATGRSSTTAASAASSEGSMMLAFS